MKKITCLFLLVAALGACTPKPENKVDNPACHILFHLSQRKCH